MSWTRSTSILIAAAVAVVVAMPCAPVNAQGGSGASRDPGDPKATVPPVRYDSAFARYRPNADVEVGRWRDANDSVGRIGGWRVYGREALADPKVERALAESTSGSSGASKPGHGQMQREAR